MAESERCGFCEDGRFTFSVSKQTDRTIDCPYCDGTGFVRSLSSKEPGSSLTPETDPTAIERVEAIPALPQEDE